MLNKNYDCEYLYEVINLIDENVEEISEYYRKHDENVEKNKYGLDEDDLRDMVYNYNEATNLLDESLLIQVAWYINSQGVKEETLNEYIKKYTEDIRAKNTSPIKLLAELTYNIYFWYNETWEDVAEGYIIYRGTKEDLEEDFKQLIWDFSEEQYKFITKYEDFINFDKLIEDELESGYFCDYYEVNDHYFREG